VEASRLLTIEEIREGLAAAADWRRFMIWHGVRLTAFMVGCGLLVLGVGYVAQGHLPGLAFLFPVALAAVVLPGRVTEVRRFSRMEREFQAAEQRALTGGEVRAQDVPSIGRRAAA
jgi:hypothetical protein